MEKENYRLTPECGILNEDIRRMQSYHREKYDESIFLQTFPYSWIDTEDCSKLEKDALIARLTELLRVVKNLERVIELKEVQIDECNSMLDHLVQLNAELIRKFSDYRRQQDLNGHRFMDNKFTDTNSGPDREGAKTSESEKLCRDIISELFSAVGVESSPEEPMMNSEVSHIAVQTELDMTSDWSRLSMRPQEFPVVLTPVKVPPGLRTKSNVELGLFAENMVDELLNFRKSKSDSAVGLFRDLNEFRPTTEKSEYLSDTISYETTTWSSYHGDDNDDESIIDDGVMPEFSFVDPDSRPHTSAGLRDRDVNILVVGSDEYISSEGEDTYGIMDDTGDSEATDENNNSDDLNIGEEEENGRIELDVENDENRVDCRKDEDKNDQIEVESSKLPLVTAAAGEENIVNLDKKKKAGIKPENAPKSVDSDGKSEETGLQCSGKQMELQSKPVLLRKSSAKLLEKRPAKLNSSVMSPRKTSAALEMSPTRQLRDHSQCSRSACPSSKDLVHLSLREVPPAKLPFRSAGAAPPHRKSHDCFNSSPRMMATFPPPPQPPKNLPALSPSKVNFSNKYPVEMSDRANITLPFTPDKKKKPTGL